MYIKLPLSINYIQWILHGSFYKSPKNLKLLKGKGFGIELIFLCSVNLIRGVVEGEGLVRLVQAFVLLETFL